MINDAGKRVVVVVVFTGYSDGTVDFTQDAPYKDRFLQVRDCFVKMLDHLKHTMKHQAQCPFSPDNPQLYVVDNEEQKVKFVPHLEIKR